MGEELYVGAILLEDGDEVPCCGPSDEFKAWEYALKKKREFEAIEIEVVDTYAFRVSSK